MRADADALVIGAGPAGSAIAILLATAGWRVILVEKKQFPRQKVCGECIAAGNFPLLDKLGIGAQFRQLAGPELRRVGWIGSRNSVESEFPPCEGDYSYGRALGRDVLDAMLLDRARNAGVEVMQPAKVCGVSGTPGDFVCDITFAGKCHAAPRTRVLIDAHGSWEAGPEFALPTARREQQFSPNRNSDLFAFKASYWNSGLSRGLLPVLAFPGGYGGLVVAEAGRTTLAFCVRRDTLASCRAALPGVPAGEAVAWHVRRTCSDIGEMLDHGQRLDPWLSAGPIRPGIRVGETLDVFKVGNAAGETHPLIGEGISMALQSSFLLAQQLLRQAPETLDYAATHMANREYATAWRAAFAPRLRFAQGYAAAAMRPSVAVPIHALVRRWPSLLTDAARWAGKARPPIVLNV